MTLTEQYERIKENVPKVYEAGYKKGYAEGTVSNDEEVFQAGRKEGYEAGKADGEKEHKSFWDNYLDKGNRKRYSNAFAGVGWNEDTFNPTHDLIVNGSAQNMFNGTAITDVVTALEKNKVKLDTSKANGINYIFGQSAVTRVPKISMAGCTKITQPFTNAKQLHTIEGLEFSSTVKQTLSDDAFKGCENLVNINEVKGVIQSDVNFSFCPLLSRKSIDNIFEHFQKPDLELVETTATQWTANEDGTYPFNSIVVKLNKPLPDDVTQWMARIESYYAFTGSTMSYVSLKFNTSGEATISLTRPRYKALQVLDASGNVVDPSLYKVYEWTNSSALTATFNKKAVNKAYETSTGANDGSTSDAWLNLLSVHSNCTFVLL